jgi:triosephosphate isomerase
MILVNFKTYKETTGKKAIFLASMIADVAKETGVEIIACPQAVDLKKVAKITSVWTQHVDPIKQGKSTGWFPPEVAKEVGARGTLLNHSEHKLSVGVLDETLTRCKMVGLKTLVFADSPGEARLIAKFKPDLIGYEPPELIESKTTSVARSKSKIIEKVVKRIVRIPILVGAGIKDKKDVEISLKLGAAGVVVSSAVVLAKDPKKILTNLAEGFKR